MIRKAILFGWLALTFAACSQPKPLGDYLVLQVSEETDGCSYVNTKGEVVIPDGKYLMCQTDTFRNFAIVLHPDSAWVGINRQEEILFRIFNYDNGPDYVREGLFRIFEGNKMGFANTRGEIVIPPQFPAVYPFFERRAAFCEGCVVEQDGEYTRWSGGKWGFIDQKGERVIPALYEQVSPQFHNGQTRATKDGVKLILHHNGMEEELIPSDPGSPKG
jgi:hypothetical protein